MLCEHSYPALLLNADYRPVSIAPLSRVPWRRAFKAIRKEAVDVLAHYDHTLRSERGEVQLASVIVLKRYVDLNRPAPLTRWHVFLRDGFRCQICRQQFSTEDLTFEHVLPRSRGGVTSWENIAACCSPCNAAKGNRTLKEAGIKLLAEPYRPSLAQINALAMKFPPKETVEATWRDWLYWSSPLEP